MTRQGTAFKIAGRNGQHYKSAVENKVRLFKSEIGVYPEPLISFIIPTYKEEKILSKIAPIFSKENKRKFNFEVVVSDGGSNDKTIEIAESFADEIVIHSSSERQTIAGGRNRGAEIAKGEVFVFINADSIPENEDYFFNFIKLWSKGGGKFSDCSAIATYVTTFIDEANIKDRIFYRFHNWYVGFLNKIGLGMGRGECQIVKKEVFNRIGGYNENIAAGEDFELYMRISKFGRIGFAKELKILESPRRFRKYGYLRVVSSWFLNSLSVLIFGKSIAKEWEAVR